MIDQLLKLRRTIYTKASESIWLSATLAITHLVIVALLCTVNHDYGNAAFTSTSAQPFDRFIATTTTTMIGIITFSNVWSSLFWGAIALGCYLFPGRFQITWKSDNMFKFVETGKIKPRPKYSASKIRDSINRYQEAKAEMEKVEEQLWEQIYAYAEERDLTWYEFSVTYEMNSRPVIYELISSSGRDGDVTKLEYELGLSNSLMKLNNLDEKRQFIDQMFEQNNFLAIEIGTNDEPDYLLKAINTIEEMAKK
ncbi:hypothetical protein [Paraburkholderia aromaticivorans]|uniref:hypothetical protein n=1 Tax=Paraburkholderia aromaticivorans TaxID=2026199 RepID=UPI0038BB8F77